MGQTLTNDPDTWGENLVKRDDFYNAKEIWEAGIEVAGTVSTILGDARHVRMRHNRESRWAVRIDATTKDVVDMLWSCYTSDGGSTNGFRLIRRGEALMCICHETFHVKFTDEVIRPAYCPTHHWRAFFECVNFAEDVRIENLGEYDVPMFGTLRIRENDRLVLENIKEWQNMTVTRRACVAMFAQNSCGASVLAAVSHALSNDSEVAAIVYQAESAFSAAVNAADTTSLVLALEPVYDALCAYYPPDDEDETGGDGDETSDDDTDDGDGGSEGGSGGGSGGNGASDEPIRPDSERGKWGVIRTPSEDKPALSNRQHSDIILDGDAYCGNLRSKPDLAQHDRVAGMTGQFRKHLRRVLQENAVGAWAGKYRRGKFAVRNARNLSLGDLRLFRQHTGANGGLDYSLVLCLDSSGSVANMPGRTISDTGLAVLEASRSIPGLDVALCAYGTGIIGSIPFGYDTSVPRNASTLLKVLAGVTNGDGGGTCEENAIMWAYAASKARAATQPLIVVLTDGFPHDEDAARSCADTCRAAGMLTGAVSIGFENSPEYHDYHASATDFSQIARVTSDLIRRMMKEN